MNENRLWKKGFRYVAGIDEVGRGSFAGSVVAGCVVFTRGTRGTFNTLDTPKINDSKKLTGKQREISAIWIRKNASAWGIGEASASLINRIGIAQATKVAFRRAIADANNNFQSKYKFKIEFLLIDAFYIPYVRGTRRKNQLAIIDGDEKSVSIAAASIIAKVYRDKLMTDLNKLSKYKIYGWDKNKGYGTKLHRVAIIKHGTTRYHRKLFVETSLNKLT